MGACIYIRHQLTVHEAAEAVGATYQLNVQLSLELAYIGIVSVLFSRPPPSQTKVKEAKN